MAAPFSRTLSKQISIVRQPRSFRSFSTKARLIEIDIDSSSQADGGERDVGFKRLEDAIHNIIARRLAPDWLPFRPGASYWVPPKRRHAADNIVELVEKIKNPLSKEQAMAVAAVDRGWPSSEFFCGGAISEPVVPVEVEVQVIVPTNLGKPLAEEEEDE